MSKRYRSEEIRKTKRAARVAATKLRIVSGHFRGTKVDYSGDPTTRPMKEKTRESVFSLLGGKFEGELVLDLFGGTGILAFEAVSRGAGGAVILELARSAMSDILQNTKRLGLDDCISIHNVDTLRWLKSIEDHRTAWPDVPWIVFCCPPYRLWHAEPERMNQHLVQLFELAPEGSQMIAEVDTAFDLNEHIPSIEWDIRKYPPAFIGVARK